MRRAFLELFACCPVDRAFPLQVAEGTWKADELDEGTLACPKCGQSFRVENGIPHLGLPKEHEPEEVAASKAREAKARDADSVVYDGTVSDYQTQIELSALLCGLHLQPREVVLDLGAGTGRLTSQLAAENRVVLATDISPRSLELNRTKCEGRPATVHYFVSDACHLPLRAQTVAKVGSGMMLEHLPTPTERRRCLEEIRRVLQPGGKLALTVYNYSWRKKRKQPREGFHGADLYFYNFDRPEMAKLLSGFQVDRLTALLNLPRRLQSRRLDRLIASFPRLAGLTGQLLFAEARAL